MFESFDSHLGRLISTQDWALRTFGESAKGEKGPSEGLLDRLQHLADKPVFLKRSLPGRHGHLKWILS